MKIVTQKMNFIKYILLVFAPSHMEVGYQHVLYGMEGVCKIVWDP